MAASAVKRIPGMFSSEFEGREARVVHGKHEN